MQQLEEGPRGVLSTSAPPRPAPTAAIAPLSAEPQTRRAPPGSNLSTGAAFPSCEMPPNAFRINSSHYGRFILFGAGFCFLPRVARPRRASRPARASRVGRGGRWSCSVPDPSRSGRPAAGLQGRGYSLRSLRQSVPTVLPGQSRAILYNQGLLTAALEEYSESPPHTHTPRKINFSRERNKSSITSRSPPPSRAGCRLFKMPARPNAMLGSAAGIGGATSPDR